MVVTVYSFQTVIGKVVKASHCSRVPLNTTTMTAVEKEQCHKRLSAFCQSDFVFAMDRHRLE